MLSDNLLSSLNKQVSNEFYSSYLYLQMASWFDHRSLVGFANWMKMQAQEEAAHTMILFNYILERGSMVDLGAIPSPQAEYSSPLEVFEKTLEHEQKVTAAINNLMAMATEEKDYATKAHLDWFISEQVEEEAGVSDILGKLKLVGDDSNGLFFIDKELSARTFIIPDKLNK